MFIHLAEDSRIKLWLIVFIFTIVENNVNRTLETKKGNHLV